MTVKKNESSKWRAYERRVLSPQKGLLNRALNIHKSKGNLSKWNSGPVHILKRLLFSLFDLCASKCLAGLKSPRHQEDSLPIKEKLTKVIVTF